MWLLKSRLDVYSSRLWSRSSRSNHDLDRLLDIIDLYPYTDIE